MVTAARFSTRKVQRVMKWTYIVLITLVALGCGTASYDFGGDAATAPAEKMPRGISADFDESRSGGEAGAGEPLPSSDALQRKIIYTADVELIVEDFGPVPSEVEKLAKELDGYVASSTVSGSPGDPRSGRWTIRVPVDRYDTFLNKAKKLGEVRRVTTDSKDVSEEYYDLESRIRNKRQTEKRLLKHLDEHTGELKEILDIERELDRVLEQIEQIEGRMRVLNDLTALTTIDLSINEIRGYVPEAAPTYGTRVRRAFAGSIDTLVSTAKSVSIALIVLLPWLVVFLVPMTLLVLLVRIRRKRRR